MKGGAGLPAGLARSQDELTTLILDLDTRMPGRILELTVSAGDQASMAWCNQ